LITDPVPLAHALPWAGAAGAAVAVSLAYLLLAEGKMWRTVLGAALAAGLITTLFVAVVLRYRNPFVATTAGGVAGALAGMTTRLLHTRFKIHGLLSGILVMTALYSVNLRVLGKSNVSLQSATTLSTHADALGSFLMSGRGSLDLFGREVGAHELSILCFSLALIVACLALLYAFFRTDLGTAIRATGDSQQMMRALGVNVGNMTVAGLALANGLGGLSGALYAQYPGVSGVAMGVGVVVLGLASIILGEALVGAGHLGLTLIGAVMGSILFQQLVAIALRAGLDPVDLKLITAAFVFLCLIFPQVLGRVKGWGGRLAVGGARRA